VPPTEPLQIVERTGERQFSADLNRHKGQLLRQGNSQAAEELYRKALSIAEEQRCLEAYHLHRTPLELIAERKARRSQLTYGGNVEITRRDLREREAAPASRRIGYRRFAL